MGRARLIAIARPYGIKISRIRPCSSLYRSNAAYRASADEGNLLIKPFQARGAGGRLSAVSQIERAVSCVRTLIRRGYPDMPRWRRTLNGRYWVMDQGRPYYMTDWIEGRGLSMNARDFEWLGQALARLHSVRLSGGDGKAYTLRQIRRFSAAGRTFQRHLKMLSGKHSIAAQWFSAHGEQVEDMSVKALSVVRLPEVRRLLRQERRETRIVHGDVTVPNVIVVTDGVKLIDWDSVRPDSTYYEIAKTLSNTTGFNTELIGAFLRGYEQIRPFQPAEKRLAAALFLFPREAWMAAKNGVSGKKGDLFSLVQKSWVHRMEAAEWMRKWADAAENG